MTQTATEGGQFVTWMPVVRVRLVRDGALPYDGRLVKAPGDAFEIVKGDLMDADREQVVAIHLDTKLKVLQMERVAIDSLNSAIIHPREVFKSAILANAYGVMLVHNHPSGDCTPSEEDRAITRKVAAAGEVLGIQLVDHIIIGGTGFCSLREMGCFG